MGGDGKKGGGKFNNFPRMKMSIFNIMLCTKNIYGDFQNNFQNVGNFFSSYSNPEDSTSR